MTVRSHQCKFGRFSRGTFGGLRRPCVAEILCRNVSLDNIDEEPMFEHCIGNCYQLLEVDPDNPEAEVWCGSPTCAAYAAGEARADALGLI